MSTGIAFYPHCSLRLLFFLFSASLKVFSSAVGDMIKPKAAGSRDIEKAALRRFHRRRAATSSLRARGLWCREAAWRVMVSPRLRLNENVPLLLEALSSG